MSRGSCMRSTTAGTPIGATRCRSAPGRTLHAAFVAQTPGKWPLASASPDARAQGLKAWFQVS